MSMVARLVASLCRLLSKSGRCDSSKPTESRSSSSPSDSASAPAQQSATPQEYLDPDLRHRLARLSKLELAQLDSGIPLTWKDLH